MMHMCIIPQVLDCSRSSAGATGFQAVNLPLDPPFDRLQARQRRGASAAPILTGAG
jgi:hypothetical protein